MNRFYRILQPLCLLGFIVCISSSWWLADIATGTATLPASTLGILTSIQYSLAALCMLGVWASTSANQPWKNIRWILYIGIISRLIIIPAASYTSNDIDRYLWDGSVAIAGFDPYITSPNSPQVEDLRELWPTPSEHAHYATIYPPLAITTFAAVASVGPEYAHLVWKMVTSLAGILTLLLALKLLRNANKLQHLALVSLSPILILETGIAAHLDVFVVLATTAALLALQCQQYRRLGFFIGVGTLYKLLPIFFLLPLLIHLRKSYTWMPLLATATMTIITGYSSMFLAGMQPIGVIGVFFEKWRFGSPLFELLEQSLANSAIGLIAIIFLLSLIGLIIICKISLNNKIHGMQWAVAIPLLISPVVFPWYLSILVPLIALLPSGFFIAWLCTMPLTYEVLGQFVSDNVWMPASWPLVSIAVAWLCGALYDYSHTKHPIH